MIYLEKGQKVFEKPELVVYEQTGERNDTDMVICAKIETPEEPFCWLEAQYIAYGNVVYSISDDKELEKEILKMDPDSTINDVAAAPVEGVVSPEPTPVTSATSTPEVVPEVVPDPAPQQTPTPPASGEPISGSGTSTPPVTETASSSASSTPEVVPEPVPEPTPEVVPEVVVPEPAPVIPEAPAIVPTEETTVVPEAIISTSSRRGRRKLG